MDSKQFHRRVFGVVGLLGLVLLVMTSTLYQVQIIDGASYLPQTAKSTFTYTNVESARGEIFDRYGRPLVTNSTAYEVTLDGDDMGKSQGDIITALLDICRSEEIAWTDTTPITSSAPYFFTSADPYYYVAPDVLDRPTRYLTRLGKLALRMEWIENDPSDKDYYDTYLPTANELMVLICQEFGLLDEGETTVTTELREVAGVMYELLQRKEEVNFLDYTFAEDVNINFISRVKEQNLAGVIIAPVTTRVYHTEYAAHLLGRANGLSAEEWTYWKGLDIGYQMDDIVGEDGIERAFESYLRGIDGVMATEISPEGEVVGQSWRTEPSPGKDITLTLDIDLQKKVEDTFVEMLPMLASDEVEGAACVILDVNSAEVLASGSYPTFNLATYSQDYNENLQNPLNPFNNRAMTGLYAPGSTFKMVTSIAALEEGIVTPQTQIYDKGVYTYYQENGPQCWIYRQYGGTHGNQNVTQAIMNSCNYYMYEVGRQLGIDRLNEYAELFGLGEKTGIELPESTGRMAGPEVNESLGVTWYDGSTLSVAIGQDNSLFTPLQLANYIATLVNGGTRYSTHILKDARDAITHEVVEITQPTAVDTVIFEKENLDAVKEGMLALTESGSVARYFADLEVAVGAKTGSAQVSASSQSNAVFVAFAPYDDPQVALALVVEHGGGGSDLGLIAAELLDYYFTAQQFRDPLPAEGSLVR